MNNTDRTPMMRTGTAAALIISLLVVFIMLVPAGDGDCPFGRQSDVQKDARVGRRSAAGEVERVINASGVDPARRRFKELQGQEDRAFYLDENEMNALGYRLLQSGKMAEAIAVFEMNTAAFPQSWNPWDSLAQACMFSGDNEKAEACFGRSLAINPGAVSSNDGLSRLRGYRLDAQGETKESSRFKPGARTGVQGPYFGETPPGLEPRVFAPGIVSTAGNFEFAITFSPDGKEIYFTRRNDVDDRNAIMVSRWEPDGWSAPEEAAFCKGFPSNEPHITPDGTRLFFGCNRQRPGGDQPEYGIWVTERTAEGGWGEPRYHGPGMYVSSSRTGDLYMTDVFNTAGGGIVRYPNSGGTLGGPEPVGGGVNAPRASSHAFISPDERFIVFDSDFRPGGQGGEGDLWVCFKKPDGTWSEASNLGDAVNTPATNFCPSLSPDGRYLFYGTCHDIYWVSAGIIERLRPKEADPASPTFDPGKTYPVEALKEDLKILCDMLEEGHGGFDRYTPEASLKTSFDQAGSGLTAPLTEFDFYSRLLPLVAEIKDGHTRLALSPGASAYLDGQAVFLPFALRFLKDKAYIFRNLSSDAGLKDGAELLAIDGTPIRDVVSALLPLVPSDAGIRTGRLRRLEHPAVFGRLLALRFGRRESRRIRYRPFQGGDTQERLALGISASDIARLLAERYPATAERRPTYELSLKGVTAVLTIRSFSDDPDKTRPRFPEFLNETFRSLGERKIPNLIIDLRGNGGGLDEYGKLLFAHIMDRPFLYYWALETKKDRYDLFRYTNETAETAEELAKPLRKNARGRFDVTGHPNRGLQTPREPRFAGRVAILIDGGSFSATGETTSAFHYYRKAVFFGEECGSGYYGNTSGFMVTATLPNTRIQIRIPLVLYTMAVEGYPKDRGILPDFPVTPTIGDLLAGRDPVMQRAREFLEKGR